MTNVTDNRRQKNKLSLGHVTIQGLPICIKQIDVSSWLAPRRVMAASEGLKGASRLAIWARVLPGGPVHQPTPLSETNRPPRARVHGSFSPLLGDDARLIAFVGWTGAPRSG